MAELKATMILVPESSYKDLCRAQVTMEILQEYRAAHDDYDFERFAKAVFPKKKEEAAPDA